MDLVEIKIDETQSNWLNSLCFRSIGEWLAASGDRQITYSNLVLEQAIRAVSVK